MSDHQCHLPNCNEPLATETLCERHAEKLLGRRPAEPQDDDEDRARPPRDLHIGLA